MTGLFFIFFADCQHNANKRKHQRSELDHQCQCFRNRQKATPFVEVGKCS